MKKILLGFVASIAMFMSSCDMDTKNYGVLDQESSIENVQDAKSFLNGIYVQLRGISSGAYTVYGEMQMDQFVATVDFGNRIGAFSTGQITSSDTDIVDMYYAAYMVANYANFFLPRVDALIESEEVSEAEKAELRYYNGVAHFARAYAYWWLFDKFVFYKESNLNTEGTGLQIVTEYSPSSDRATYVGRSSLKATIDFINGELAAAYSAIRDYENNVSIEYCQPNASRINSYAVAALQARFALQTNDYATAKAKAEEVINCGKFELTSIDDYEDMWVYDEGNELIFVPFADKGQGYTTIGRNWYSDNQENKSDYLPTVSVLASYGEGDVRFDAFFSLYQMTISGGKYYGYAFTKYPGNPDLNSTASNGNRQKAKPFRLSEQYLIAAEACAVDGASKDEAKANSYLNELRSNRIEGYTSMTYSGTALLNAVKAERAKELIGEGLRMGDLRRWGNGFTRVAQFEALGSPFDAISEVIVNSTNNVTYQPADNHFVWPIPFREMQVNPNLAGQQNPGY